MIKILTSWKSEAAAWNSETIMIASSIITPLASNWNWLGALAVIELEISFKWFHWVFILICNKKSSELWPVLVAEPGVRNCVDILVVINWPICYLFCKLFSVNYFETNCSSSKSIKQKLLKSKNITWLTMC